MHNSQIPSDFKLSSSSFKGKTILITGATDGIGRCAALYFARAGATVVLHGRSETKLEELYDEIEQEGLAQPAIYCLSLESANAEAYTAMHDALANEFPKLDGLLINAAELGARTPVQQYSPERWATVMQVNINASFLLSRALLPLIRNSEHGRILFTSDQSASQGKAYSAAYSVSKAASDALMKVLAEELDGLGDICVNSVDPGATRTRLRLNAYPAEDPMTVSPASKLMPSYAYLLSPICTQSGKIFRAQPEHKSLEP
ncbi:YciK family oxidoreductase [Agaribacterium sp. ZY112]|uniref:YciK family oxidoreductase n=1 Tax=Agaribacterium sp. ZY112 TaxID=3233574 RepID=UPI003524DCFC